MCCPRQLESGFGPKAQVSPQSFQSGECTSLYRIRPGKGTGKVVSLDLQPMVGLHSTCCWPVLIIGAVTGNHYFANRYYATIDDTPRPRCFRWEESGLGSLRRCTGWQVI